MIPDLAGTAAAVEITIDEIRRIANTTIPATEEDATKATQSFRDLAVDTAAFGGHPLAKELAHQHRGAHEVFVETINGVIRDLQEFADKLRESMDSHEQNDDAIAAMLLPSPRSTTGTRLPLGRGNGRRAPTRPTTSPPPGSRGHQPGLRLARPAAPPRSSPSTRPAGPGHGRRQHRTTRPARRLQLSGASRRRVRTDGVRTARAAAAPALVGVRRARARRGALARAGLGRSAAPVAAHGDESGLPSWWFDAMKLKRRIGESTGKGVAVAVVDVAIDRSAADIKGADVTLTIRTAPAPR